MNTQNKRRLGIAGHTPVLLATDKYVAIKDLYDNQNKPPHYPTLLSTYSEELNTYITTQQAMIFSAKTDALYEIKYSAHGAFHTAKGMIQCAENQQFLIATELAETTTHPQMPNVTFHKEKFQWMDAKDLKPNMRLFSPDLFITIDEVKQLTGFKDVYTMTTCNCHSENFCIDFGIVTRNMP